MGDEVVNILLVEDNPADARLIEEMLRDVPSGRFDLTHVERLADALQRVSERGFDVILLDLRLPDSEGFATYERVHAEAQDTPIVILSGMSDETLAVRAVQEGAQDYLVKGKVDGESLARAIRYAVVRHGTQARLLSQHRPAKRGRVIGFVGAKGGVGTTTAVLNIASAAAGHEKSAIAAEFRPYFGTFAAFLGRSPSKNLSHLCSLEAEQIAATDLGPWLMTFEHGLKALFGPQSTEEMKECSPEQAQAIIEKLASVGDYVFLDLASCPSPTVEAGSQHCDFIVVVLVPEPACIAAGKFLLALLDMWGLATERTFGLVINHPGMSTGMNMADIRFQLGCELIGVIPPVEEDLILVAQRRGMPLVLAFPDDVASMSFTEVSEHLTEDRVTPVSF